MKSALFVLPVLLAWGTQGIAQDHVIATSKGEYDFSEDWGEDAVVTYSEYWVGDPKEVSGPIWFRTAEITKAWPHEDNTFTYIDGSGSTVWVTKAYEAGSDPGQRIRLRRLEAYGNCLTNTFDLQVRGSDEKIILERPNDGTVGRRLLDFLCGKRNQKKNIVVGSLANFVVGREKAK